MANTEIGESSRSHDPPRQDALSDRSSFQTALPDKPARQTSVPEDVAMEDQPRPFAAGSVTSRSRSNRRRERTSPHPELPSSERSTSNDEITSLAEQLEDAAIQADKEARQRRRSGGNTVPGARSSRSAGKQPARPPPTSARNAPGRSAASSSRRPQSQARRNPGARLPKKAPRKVAARPVPKKKSRAVIQNNRTGKVRRPNVETKWTLKKLPKTYGSNSNRCRALREIRKFQQSTDFLIPKLAFMRLVKEIMGEVAWFHDSPFRVQRQALLALQEMAEVFLVNEFENINLLAIHARRVTIQQKDWALLKRIRKNMTGFEVPGA